MTDILTHPEFWAGVTGLTLAVIGAVFVKRSKGSRERRKRRRQVRGK